MANYYSAVLPIYQAILYPDARLMPSPGKTATTDAHCLLSLCSINGINGGQAGDLTIVLTALSKRPSVVPP
jgi:hypothetical protein